MKVYVVMHAHGEYDDEEIKLLGVFSTEESASQAIEQLRTQPGFRDHPTGFHTDAYTLDEVCWSDGFVTAEPEDSGNSDHE